MTKRAWASTMGLTFASRRVSGGCFSPGVHIKLVFPFHILLVLFELLEIRSKGTPILPVDPHPQVDLQHTGRQQLYRPGACHCSRHEACHAFKCLDCRGIGMHMVHRSRTHQPWMWDRQQHADAWVGSLLGLLSTGLTYMKDLEAVSGAISVNELCY